MELYLCGMITVCYWVIATLFLRFWRETHDRLFLLFALAFATMGLNRLPLAFLATDSAWAIYPYIVRFIAFGSILAAIVDKNLQSRKPR
jgi:hypothetical protein